MELGTDGENDGNLTESDVEKGSGAFYCTICCKSVKRKDNYRRHMLKCHNTDYVAENISANSRNMCIYPNCDKAFYHKSRMIKHLRIDHNMSVEEENVEFPSFSDFVAWKEAEENGSLVSFSKRDERKINAVTKYSSYVCNADGRRNTKEHAHRLRSERRKGSIKKNIVCPARMLVRENLQTGCIKVHYIRSHNHAILLIDAEHHPLPSSVEREIEEKLLEGKSVDRIRQELQGDALNPDQAVALSSVKKSSISRNSIRHLQKKLKTDCSKTIPTVDISSTSIEERLQKLTTELLNPVLLYQSAANSVSPGPCGTVDNLDFTFLALQTKNQKLAYEKFSDKIVLLDHTDMSEENHFHILSVRVLDENNLVVNAAHLVTSKYESSIILLFFTALSQRCNVRVSAVMAVEKGIAVDCFQQVYGMQVQYQQPKWFVHRDWYLRIAQETCLKPESQSQMYFCLVSLMETDYVGTFQTMRTDLTTAFKGKCPLLMSYLLTTYFAEPKSWASCHRCRSYGDYDRYLCESDFATRFYSVSRKSEHDLSFEDILHILLDVNEWDDFHYRCRQTLRDSTTEQSDHEKGLAIPDVHVQLSGAGVWAISDSDSSCFHVTWKTDACGMEFCQIRCLKLTCFGLCSHLYTCSCNETSLLCSHIHKVHSMRTGISWCWSELFAARSECVTKTPFKLFSHILPMNVPENMLALQTSTTVCTDTPSDALVKETASSVRELLKCVESGKISPASCLHEVNNFVLAILKKSDNKGCENSACSAGFAKSTD